MCIAWRIGGSIILNRAWRTIEENEASGVLESTVLVPVEWSVWICLTWGEVFEVLGTWDDKLSKSSEKWSIRIISILVKLWVVDGIENKVIWSRDNMTRHIKFLSY